MSCKWCDLGAGISGPIKPEGDTPLGCKAYVMVSDSIGGAVLLAQGKEEVESTAVGITHCPWCGRRLDGKGAGE